MPQTPELPVDRPLDATGEDLSDVVLLPFSLADSDESDARTLVTVPVAVPEDYLAAILFLRTTPGGLPAGDHVARWAEFAEFLIAAGLHQVAARWLPEVRAIADRDPVALVWWEQCRQQVQDLFPHP